MQAISTDMFMESATTVGVGFDPRYPDARSLGFLADNKASRFWVRPEDESSWPDFVSSVLRAARVSDRVMAKMRWGTWRGASPRNELERLRAKVSGLLEVPDGWPGAIEFGSGDRERLVALLARQLAEPVDDMYVLDCAGTALLQFSHHDVVHVSCPTTQAIEDVVSAMRTAGYELPDHPPDATFKWPAWMPGQ